MRHLFFFFLLLQISTGGRVGEELAYLPQLVKHYREHQRENPQLTVFQFLVLHYQDGKHLNSDKRHETLPFRIHTHYAGVSLSTLPDNCLHRIPEAALSWPQVNCFSYQFLLPKGFVATLFQPPKRFFPER